jgi:hypothetical protein
MLTNSDQVRRQKDRTPAFGVQGAGFLGSVLPR